VPHAINRILTEENRLYDHERYLAWLRNGSCPECGSPSTRINATESHRCRKCANNTQITSVKPGALRCHACQKWKADAEFPTTGMARFAYRRGRRNMCRSCETKSRYRRRGAERVQTHNRSGYTNGCRCDICREANTRYAAERRSRA
jgi:hypothetical protein